MPRKPLTDAQRCTVVRRGYRCAGRREARGFCAKHYRRWQRWGDPNVVRRPANNRRPVRVQPMNTTTVVRCVRLPAEVARALDLEAAKGGVRVNRYLKDLVLTALRGAGHRV